MAKQKINKNHNIDHGGTIFNSVRSEMIGHNLANGQWFHSVSWAEIAPSLTRRARHPGFYLAYIGLGHIHGEDFFGDGGFFLFLVA